MSATAVLTIVIRIILVFSLTGGALTLFVFFRANQVAKVHPGDEKRAFFLQRVGLGARNGAENWEPRWRGFVVPSFIFLGIPALGVLGMWYPGE